MIRETSNKALNAINAINLIPFLMSFLSSRDKLPVSTVVAAGSYFAAALLSSRPIDFIRAAQCSYVLTDDNQAAIDEVRHDAAYSSCLLDILRGNQHDPKGKGKDLSEDRFETLKVLCCGEILCVLGCVGIIDQAGSQAS